MATKKQCEAALLGLAKRLDDVDGSLKKRHAPDRTVICRIPDLNTTFSGRLASGALRDITDTPLNDAQIKLTVSSDDLLAVTAGDLPFASAWAEGRLKIEASVLDMIRLRSLL
jgi:putative sterol carrier protein